MGDSLRAKLLVAALGLAAGLAMQPARANPPVSALGNLPLASDPSLSPDGKYFAVIQMVGGMPAALIYPVGSATPSIIKSDKWLVVALHWVKPDRLLLTLKVNVTAHGDYQLRTWVRYATVKPDGSGFQIMMSNDPAFRFNIRTGGVIDTDLDDPDHVFMPLGITDFGGETLRDSVMKVDVATGDAQPAMIALPQTYKWVMDGHGNVVARVDRLDNPLRDSIRVFDGRDWESDGTIVATADRGASVAGLTEDGKALARFAYDTNGMKIMARRDLATQHEETLFSNPDYSVSAAISDDWTSRIVGATFVADRTEYVYFDPNREALQKGLEKAFPDRSVTIASYDRSMDKVIVIVEAPKHPPVFYYLDRTTHQATQIASTYPDLKPDDLGQMKPYPYSARDGLKIPAYITLPPGRDPKKLPAVVLPHGGPDARDEIEFNWWAQFLANRGYVVLQPNYRGSSGYGDKFTSEGLHQWGLKMQDDITDGVKKMIADGIADPKRICIVGASYGGYAALAGATFTPDLYACAASMAGISDLRQLLRRERKQYGPQSGVVSFWQSRIGDFSDDAEQLVATSPAFHAGRVKCPILLLHGADDTTVWIEQSRIMEDALQKAGKPVQFVTLQGDDHYFTLPETRIRMLTELEAFLKKNIGN